MTCDNRQYPWVEVICPCREDEFTLPKHCDTSSNSNLLSTGHESFQKNASKDSTSDNQDKKSHSPRDKDVIPKSLWDPFSRHKLEYLYFCEHCQNIKCPRCIDQEIVCRYCPICLFEVTPATARSEGNRCPRNCFQCPLCLTPINPKPVIGTASSLGQTQSRAGTRNLSKDNHLLDSQAQSSTYKLECTNCEWTSDFFESDVNNNAEGDEQLKFKRGRPLMQQLQNVEGRYLNSETRRFQDLQLFYFQRSLEEGTRAALVDDRIFGPLSSNRYNEDEKDINSMISNRASQIRSFAEILEQRIQERNKKDTSAEIFREIEEVDEATDQRKAAQRSTTIASNFLEYQDKISTLLKTKDNTSENEYNETEEIYEIEEDQDTEIPHTLDISSTSLPAKKAAITRDQLDSEQKLPVPQPLRSKHTKRCSSCHRVLIKPDSKPSSARFKIKLLAHNYLPNLRLSEFPPKSGYPIEFVPEKVYTLLLTITNPMHVAVKVSLATLSRPSITKNSKNSMVNESLVDDNNTSISTGKYPHKVTIITPTVYLGPDEELWDEASLIRGVPSMFIKRESAVSKRIEVEGSRISAKTIPATSDGTNNDDSKPLGAGVYQQCSNWSCIAIEVVPSSKASFFEIPLFVNFSFEVPPEDDENSGGKAAETDDTKQKGKNESKEKKSQSISDSPEIMTFGYWAVLGAGPIKRDS